MLDLRSNALAPCVNWQTRRRPPSSSSAFRTWRLDTRTTV